MVSRLSLFYFFTVSSYLGQLVRVDGIYQLVRSCRFKFLVFHLLALAHWESFQYEVLFFFLKLKKINIFNCKDNTDITESFEKKNNFKKFIPISGFSILFATLTYYNKLNGLKQHKYIIFWFYQSFSEVGRSGLKIKVLAGVHYFMEILGKIFILPFQLLELTIRISVFKAKSWLLLSLHRSGTDSLPPSLACRGLWGYIPQWFYI